MFVNHTVTFISVSNLDRYAFIVKWSRPRWLRRSGRSPARRLARTRRRRGAGLLATSWDTCCFQRIVDDDWLRWTKTFLLSPMRDPVYVSAITGENVAVQCRTSFHRYKTPRASLRWRQRAVSTESWGPPLRRAPVGPAQWAPRGHSRRLRRCLDTPLVYHSRNAQASIVFSLRVYVLQCVPTECRHVRRVVRGTPVRSRHATVNASCLCNCGLWV